LKGSPPESSHCNNIGPLHREEIYKAFERWFGMKVPEEYSNRRPPEELHCLTPEAIREFRPRPLHELAAELGARSALEARRRLAGLSARARLERLRHDWTRLLGDVEPKDDPKVQSQSKEHTASGSSERIVLDVGQGIVVPFLLRVPPPRPPARAPIVIGLASDGKQAFLNARSESIAAWLEGGAAVCLIDVRGTGETRLPEDARRYNSASTALSAAEWMLGQCLVGSRLRDVRSVLRYLRLRTELDASRVVLWGDSFAPPNREGRNLAVPLDADPQPHQAEPLGGLLALFGALYEEDVRAVYVRGCLTGFDSLLNSPFCYVPHDALIPGAVTAGDLIGVAASLAPRPLWVEGSVDGLDRTVQPDRVRAITEPVRSAYRAASAEPRLTIGEGEQAQSHSPTRWVIDQLFAR
jgi:hypothetical protein